MRLTVSQRSRREHTQVEPFCAYFRRLCRPLVAAHSGGYMRVVVDIVPMVPPAETTTWLHVYALAAGRERPVLPLIGCSDVK